MRTSHWYTDKFYASRRTKGYPWGPFPYPPSQWAYWNPWGHLGEPFYRILSKKRSQYPLVPHYSQAPIDQPLAPQDRLVLHHLPPVRYAPFVMGRHSRLQMEQNSPPSLKFSLSLDEAVMPPAPSYTVNLQAFQDLMK